MITSYVVLPYSEIGNPRATSDFQKACDMGSEQGCSYLQKALKKS